MAQNGCKEYKDQNCTGCSHEYIKYIKNGTKSFCDIDEEEITSTSQRCDAYTRETQVI